MNKNKNLILLVVSMLLIIAVLFYKNNGKAPVVQQDEQSASVFKSWIHNTSGPRGVYVAMFGTDSIPDYVLSAPGVSGIFLRTNWSSVEKTADDAYNWTKIDSQLQQIYDYNQAHGTNIRASVGIAAGKFTPVWVGGQRGNFSEIPNNGDSNNLVDYTIPVPYDTQYSTAFNDLIRDFATHLKTNQNTYNLISTVKVTGINTNSAETRLPYQANVVSTNGLYTSANNLAIWQNLAYNPTSVKSVYRNFLKTFATSFKDKSISTAIIPAGKAFPNIDDSGSIYAPGSVEDITFQIMRIGYNNYPIQNVIQYNGLTPVLGPVTSDYMKVAKDYGGIWGYQLVQDKFEILPCVDQTTFVLNSTPCTQNQQEFVDSLNVAVNDGASFVEIFPQDLIAFSSTVQNINSMLNSPNPKTPTNIKITNVTADGATITWNESRDFEFDLSGYNIYSGPSFTTKVNPSIITDKMYNFTNLSAGNIYTYKMEAVDSLGHVSQLSDVITFATKDITPPSTPSNLSALSIKPNYVLLKFDASTDDKGVYRYNVQRNGIIIGKALDGMTNFIDYNVTPGATYNYTIKAMDKSKNISGPSNNVSVTIPQYSGSDSIQPDLTLNTLDGAVFKQNRNGFFGSTDGQSGMGPVLVLVDDVEVLASPVKVTNYTFDTTMFIDGTHTFKVVVFDASPNGNKNSDSRQIEIKNNISQ